MMLLLNTSSFNCSSPNVLAEPARPRSVVRMALCTYLLARDKSKIKWRSESGVPDENRWWFSETRVGRMQVAIRKAEEITAYRRRG